MKPNSKYKTVFYIILITLFIGTTLPAKSQEKSHKSSKKENVVTKLSVKNMQADLAVLWSDNKRNTSGI